MKKVGVEKTLSNVRQYLESKDCTVETLESGNKENRRALDKYDAIVVTGADTNLLGMQDTLTNTRVISAQGKNAEEIYNEIQAVSDLKNK